VARFYNRADTHRHAEDTKIHTPSAADSAAGLASMSTRMMVGQSALAVDGTRDAAPLPDDDALASVIQRHTATCSGIHPR
jgi:hypothetical protein